MLPRVRGDLKRKKQNKRQNTHARTRARTAAKQWPYLLSITGVCCREIAAAIASSAMSIFYQSTRVLQASSTAIAPLSLLLLLANLAISPHSFLCCHLQGSVFKPPSQRTHPSSPFSLRCPPREPQLGKKTARLRHTLRLVV